MALRHYLRQTPQGAQGFVHFGVRVGFRIARRSPPHDFVYPRPIDNQSGGNCFTDHPFEGELRKTALRLWITAANVAVYTREPDLLDVLRAAIWRRRVGSPQVCSEKRSPLVD